MSDDQDHGGDPRIEVGRRGVLAALASVGALSWVSFTAGTAEAATPAGFVQADTARVDRLLLNGRTSNPAAPSGYAAFVWRTDR